MVLEYTKFIILPDIDLAALDQRLHAMTDQADTVLVLFYTVFVLVCTILSCFIRGFVPRMRKLTELSPQGRPGIQALLRAGRRLHDRLHQLSEHENAAGIREGP